MGILPLVWPGQGWLTLGLMDSKRGPYSKAKLEQAAERAYEAALEQRRREVEAERLRREAAAIEAAAARACAAEAASPPGGRLLAARERGWSGSGNVRIGTRRRTCCRAVLLPCAVGQAYGC